METKEIRDEMPTDATQQLNTGRRNFIKSTSLALPAIVTLQSGTALAATSLGCGGNGNISQQYANVLIKGYPPSDNRLRGKVEICRKLVYQNVTTVGANGRSTTGKKWTITDTTPADSMLDGYFKGRADGVDVWRRMDGTIVTNGTTKATKELDAICLATGSSPPGGLNTSDFDPTCVQKFQTGNFRYAIAHIRITDGQVVSIGHKDAMNPPSNTICTSWTGTCLASIYGHGPKW